MEISGKVPPAQSKADVQGLEPAQKAKSKTTKVAGVKGDRVELSAKAKEMQAAREALKQMPDTDDEKVALIKKQLKDGTYKVDSKKIASKMVDESLLRDMD